MSSDDAVRAFFVKRCPRNSTPDASQQLRRLIFDGDGVLHQPLTLFAHFASGRLADESVRTYLSALCRYFTWLRQASRRGRVWKAPGAQVRADVLEYLVAVLGCQVREHRLGFMSVQLTQGHRSDVSGFLSALRLFYSAMMSEGTYRGSNPLARPVAHHSASQRALTGRSDLPRMPLISGCAAEASSDQGSADPRKTSSRLTDCYFVIVNEHWTPQPIDDPTFPAQIFAAGERACWRLRERLVARLLFETGARVHEVCALTLGDWWARGLQQEATSLNKGSGQRRVKFVRWSPGTTKLLQRYFDSERLAADPQQRTLSAYLAHPQQERQALYNVPLFLTAAGRALTAKTFRDLYWRPACRAAGIEADIHQARHWYVTMAIRSIYEEGRQDLSTERRLEELIRYMAWRGGKLTLNAYEHHFTAIRHAELQARLHRRLDRVLRKPPKRPTSSPASPPQPHPIDVEWAFLRRLGGH